MSNKIKHSGIVDNITADCVKVRILQASACAHCKVAGHCNASESKEKIVDVYSVDATNKLKAGDKVIVSASMRTAVNALMLGFGGPLFFMLSTLVLLYVTMEDEAIAALGSLAILVPYFAILYLFKDKMRRKMTFEIER